MLVLFWLLVPRRWLAPKAGAAAALVAILVAVFIYGMPPGMASWRLRPGAGFGLLPVGWTIFNAMLLYNITVQTGQFDIVRRSVAGLSGDARIQAILIGFAFGAFLEGAAGGGTPVAICGAIMVGLGFDPFLAAVLCLIANTSPVAYGGLGTPLITLTGVTGLPTETLSIMAGHQLPLLSLFIPLYMVKVHVLVEADAGKSGRPCWSPAARSPASSSCSPPCTSYVRTGALSHDRHRRRHLFAGRHAIFLQFWKPKQGMALRQDARHDVQADAPRPQLDPNDPHAAEAQALLGATGRAAARTNRR